MTEESRGKEGEGDPSPQPAPRPRPVDPAIKREPTREVKAGEKLEDQPFRTGGPK